MPKLILKAVYSASTVSLGTSIDAVNDAPVRTAGREITLNIDEDSASTATSLGLGVYTYSAGGGADEEAQTLSYKFTNIPSSITLWKDDGTTQVTTDTTGLTLSDLQGLTYKTVANANNSTAQNLTWTVTDDGTGTISITETISVKVNAVNDAPVNSLANSSVTVVANIATFNSLDSQLAYTPEAITGLSIADEDAVDGSMSVTLSVTNGSLAHNTYNGVTFTDTSPSRFTASGSKADLNNWLASTGGVSYTPTDGFKGIRIHLVP